VVTPDSGNPAQALDFFGALENITDIPKTKKDENSKHISKDTHLHGLKNSKRKQMKAAVEEDKEEQASEHMRKRKKRKTETTEGESVVLLNTSNTTNSMHS